MLLKITHETELSYNEPIVESVMELRMFPRQENHQHRLSFELKLSPYSAVNSYFDWLGNTVHTFTVNQLHQSIQIRTTSVVETERLMLVPESLPDTWPMQQNKLDYRLWDFLQFGGPVVASDALADLSRELAPRNGIRIGELGQRMIRLINMRFEYEKGVTTSASPVTEILEHRKGVCQDFTHLFIALARYLKIPARYVSGLLHPDDTDRERFRGYTQTHAWAELYFPSTGWIGFDPTNSCIAGENFVKVAVGRDYRDVPPNKGLYRGNAKETIQASVHSEVLQTIPSDLFPEKIAPLSTSASQKPRFFLRTVDSHNQDHVQQQQQEKSPLVQQQQQQQQYRFDL